MKKKKRKKKKTGKPLKKSDTMGISGIRLALSAFMLPHQIEVCPFGSLFYYCSASHEVGRPI